MRDILPEQGSSAIRVYARVGALQETKTRPEDFLHEVARVRCAAVLRCLWPSAHPNDPTKYPDAQEYLRQFKAGGWRIRSLALLGQNAGGIRSPDLRQFAQATVSPINVTASAVCAHFGWE